MRGRTSTAGTSPGMGPDLLQVIEQIGREKGIDSEVLIGALEDAITAATRKGQERGQPAIRPAADPTRPASRGQENLVARLNRKTGEIQVFARRRVADEVTDPATEIDLKSARRLEPGVEVGGFVDEPRTSTGLGRIEAQAAKQVIFLKVREAERELVYSEYASRLGELVNGAVKRFDRGDVVVELGRTEAVLPRRAQSRSEIYAQGDRVRAVIVEVSKNPKGPQIVLSRTDPSVLLKLFEMEVPEIYDGTVSVRHVVREPGERAKIAVSSRQKDVDAVGACVGVKGARVQAIIRELRGEKIDIVAWDDDLTALATNALNQKKVISVSIHDDPERRLEMVVDDQQLSLAIGKRGQNVRLASKLVGWPIDLRGTTDSSGPPAEAANPAAIGEGGSPAGSGGEIAESGEK